MWWVGTKERRRSKSLFMRLKLERVHLGIGIILVFRTSFLLPPSHPSTNCFLNENRQTGLNGKVFQYRQGHVLGGGSSTNSMIYVRGSSQDYDRFARLTNEPSWSWTSLFPYFLKSETFVASADGHDSSKQHDPAVHGRGPVGVSTAGYSYTLDSLMFNATAELSNEFPFNLDYNSGKPLGFGWTQSAIRGGERVSAATAYLSKKVLLERKNLHVLVGATATKISGTKQAIDTVTFVHSSTSSPLSLSL
jgi:choline dehydrogenase-like flavoprotein